MATNAASPPSRGGPGSRMEDFTGAKLTGDITGHCYQLKGAKAYQEDSCCVFWSPDESVVVGCVFDGHGGINGRVASMHCVRLTQDYFFRHFSELASWNKKKWQAEMDKFFAKMHDGVRKEFIKLEKARRSLSGQPMEKIVDSRGIVRKYTGHPVHGGTTGTICTIINLPTMRRAVCANVGDSDCLIMPGKPKNQNDKYEHLSVDHGPDSLDEFKRIQSLNLETSLIFVYDKSGMKKYNCPRVFSKHGEKNVKYSKDPWGMGLRPTNVRYDPGVYAVTPKEIEQDTTCIAMTRSIGDIYAHQFGMTTSPSITIKEFPLDVEYNIAVGSDGIWDCWKWSDFADFLNGCLSKYNVVTGTEALVQHTIARAKACFGSNSYDDASLSILQIKPQSVDSLNSKVGKLSIEESGVTATKSER